MHQLHIKRFIDKMSILEGKQSKDFVMPIIEARGLRDELAKILADLHDINTEKEVAEPVIQIEIKGGTFK